jgi:DNA topoisomerase-1
MKNLVIVESPNKIKSIENYLGSDYKVLASVGHIFHLTTGGQERLGIETKT